MQGTAAGLGWAVRLKCCNAFKAGLQWSRGVAVENLTCKHQLTRGKVG